MEINVIIVICQVEKLRLRRFSLYAPEEMLGWKGRNLTSCSVIAKAKFLPQMESAEPLFF